MIEPDQFDAKLAGGGSGPTIGSASSLVAPRTKSNSPGCERKAKQTEHEEDARTPY
jgi:hypothetical protein